jgi:hypothetical protein
MNTLNGVAVLDTPLNMEESFPLWWNKHKWKGIFNVRWIYVKNVDLTPLNMREGPKKIYELHDGTELSEDNGMSLVRIFKSYDTSNNIFSLFPILDMREDKLMDYRKNLGFEIKLTKIKKESTNVDYSFPAKSRGDRRESLKDDRDEQPYNDNDNEYKNSWNCSDSEDNSDDYEPKGKDKRGSYNRKKSTGQNYAYQLKKENPDTETQTPKEDCGNADGVGLNNNTGMYYQLQKNVRGGPQGGEGWNGNKNAAELVDRRDGGQNQGGKN